MTAFSAAESEYIAAAEAAKEAIWWRSFMDELGFPQITTIIHFSIKDSLVSGLVMF